MISALAIAAALVLVTTTAPDADDSPAATQGGGPLVVVGGGAVPEEIFARAIEVAGGADAKIVILPQASNADGHSEATVEGFLAAGASNVRSWRFDGTDQATDSDPPLARLQAVAQAIKHADLIWFSGGSQTALMAALDATGLSQLIRERHLLGTAVGGSSAGAAVMSDLMISGGGHALESVTAGSTATYSGLGLWPGVIVDQHFLKRRRNNRLLAAVLDHPDHVGIGIDEGTAVVVQGNHIEVLGESSVIVFDARNARLRPTAQGMPIAATGIVVHILVPGTSLTFDD